MMMLSYMSAVFLGDPGFSPVRMLLVNSTQILGLDVDNFFVCLYSSTYSSSVPNEDILNIFCLFFL